MCKVCDKPQTHEAETMTTPLGDSVDIDKKLVGLVRFLWDNNIKTTWSCENQSDSGIWYVAFNTCQVMQARRVIELVSDYLGGDKPLKLIFAERNILSQCSWKVEGLTEDLK